MKAVSFKDGISVIENDKIDARRIFTSDKTAAIEIHLQPGAEVEKHSTVEDAFFYILEGTASISIADTVQDVEKGSLLECPGGVSKAVFNNSTSLVKILVLKMSS